MANYPISTHNLVFSDDYSHLYVKLSGTTVSDFSLTDANAPLHIAVVSGNYALNSGSPIDDPMHKYDTDGANATLSFGGSKLGGIGLIDLRDCDKSGNLSVEYDLDCGGVRLLLTTGAKPFRVKVDDVGCYSYTEL